MSVTLTINLTGDAAERLQRLRGGLAGRAKLHARLAATTEAWLKDYGRATAADQHATADRLGAAPTRHLERAYASVESKASESAAILLIPRASRLRAAFGDYILRPGSGKKYLTIPVCAAAYGKRAGEFSDLVFVRVGPRQTPALARSEKGAGGLTIYYWLVKATRIHADRNLIPTELLLDEASDAASAYCLELTTTGGGTTP